MDGEALLVELKSVDNKVDMRNSTEPPVTDGNTPRVFSLPQGYEQMTDEDLNKWVKYEYERDE